MHMLLHCVDQEGNIALTTSHTTINSVLKNGLRHQSRCEEAGFVFKADCFMSVDEDPMPYLEVLYVRRKQYEAAGDVMRTDCIRTLEAAVMRHELPSYAEVLVINYPDGERAMYIELVDGFGRLWQKTGYGPTLSKHFDDKLEESKKKLCALGYAETYITHVQSFEKPCCSFLNDDFKLADLIPNQAAVGTVHVLLSRRLEAVLHAPGSRVHRFKGEIRDWNYVDSARLGAWPDRQRAMHRDLDAARNRQDQN